MKVIVSACLLGVPCRYKGGANTDKGVISFVAGMDVIPVCPEVAAGRVRPWKSYAAVSSGKTGRIWMKSTEPAQERS